MIGVPTRSFLWCVGGITVLLGAALGVARYQRGPAASPSPTAEAATSIAPRAEGLDAEQREYLWNIEHHGNLLNRFGFQALSQALSRGDAAALCNLLAPGFTATMPRRGQGTPVAHPVAEIQRLRDTGQGTEPLTAAAFVEQLLAYRRPFTQPPRVQINLMLLHPEQRADLEGPWQGSCLLRLTGEMGSGQPAEVSLQLEYQIPPPTEETLHRGHWLRRCALVQSQVAWAPHSLLREATAERGIDVHGFHDNWQIPLDQRATNSGGVFLCDFNRDGRLDMLIVDRSRFVLYQGLPEGKFADVTAAMRLPERFRVGDHHEERFAFFVDIDGDGWEDLLLAGHVFRNEQGKGFTDYTSRCNLKYRDKLIGVAVADYDRDGRPDLYFSYSGHLDASWLNTTCADTLGNVLWRNKGNWQFEDMTEASHTSAGHRSTFSAAWFDANNDGWPDLYVINEFGVGVLFINQTNGTFREHLMGDGPNDYGSMGLSTGDIDNDGNIDVYVGNMYSKAGTRVISNLKPGTYPPDVMTKLRQFVAGSQLWRNRGGTRFEPKGKEYGVAAIGWSYGPALVDLDNDGWLDLCATCGFTSQSRSDPDG